MSASHNDKSASLESINNKAVIMMMSGAQKVLSVKSLVEKRLFLNVTQDLKGRARCQSESKPATSKPTKDSYSDLQRSASFRNK